MRTSALGLACILCAAQVLGEAAGRFRISPFVQAVTESSAVIVWEWERPAETSLLYGESSDYGDTVALARRERIETELSGLEPAAKYHYNVLLGDTTLLDRNVHFFYTAPSDKRESVVFAVIGDTRGGEESFDADHRSVIRSIQNYTFPSFLLHTGDLVTHLQPNRWKTFFDIEGELLRQCPIFPVRGNSDGGPHELQRVFHLPGKRPWYSFRWGGVFVIALDLPSGKTDRFYRKAIGPGSPQYAWLTQTLASEERRSCPFTVVFCYAPLVQPAQRDESYLIGLLGPLFDRHGVDCVISGGLHYFVYARRGNVAYVVSGGGGAELERPQRNVSEAVRFFHSAFHHLRLTAQYTTLTLEAVDNTGGVFFSHALSSRALGSESTRQPPARAGAGTGTADSLRLTIFGTAECDECEKLKQYVVPAVERRLNSTGIKVTFVDLDNEENYERYRLLEARRGARQHSFPVIALGDTLLSGSDLSVERIEAAVRNHRDSLMSPAPPTTRQWTPWLLAAAALAAVAGVLAARGRNRET